MKVYNVEVHTDLDREDLKIVLEQISDTYSSLVDIWFGKVELIEEDDE